MKLSVLSNTNVQQLTQSLSRDYKIYQDEGYNNWLPLLLDSSSSLYQFSPDLIFILLDAQELLSIAPINQQQIPNLDFQNDLFDENKNELSSMMNTISSIVTQHPKIQFFISNLDIHDNLLQPIQFKSHHLELRLIWEQSFNDLKKITHNINLFDLNALITQYGRQQIYSAKLWYLGKQKFSMAAIDILHQEIKSISRAFLGQRKKCLIVDLDNTLWGGVVGEVGANEIELSAHKQGARFRDFQAKIKQLKPLGIILAICSKNNAEDIKEVFNANSQMILSEQDFAIMKINWDTKVENIKAIASELNIGLDSMVFIDDNPIERELVQERLPQVVVAKFPKDTSKLPLLIEQLYQQYFRVYKLTESDALKTDIYHANSQRLIEKQQSIDLSSFLENLHTIIKLEQLANHNLERAYNLIQKTNQFNLTCQRYSRQEIKALQQQEHVLFITATIADKYGDNGLVVILIVQLDQFKKTAHIKNFILSCRVMGRYIEDQIIGYLSELLITTGYRSLTASYIKQAKNKPVKNLYERLGFSVLSKQDNEKNYQFNFFQKNTPQAIKYTPYAQLSSEHINL